MRLSEQGTDTIDLTAGATGDMVSVTANTEQNVRAIANVIQIKSGEGVVMAGLIGEREEELADKIPILGDLPYVGWAFRSKSTIRQKTELLIFLEASVLDRRPEVAKAQSAHDFQLGRATSKANCFAIRWNSGCTALASAPICRRFAKVKNTIGIAITASFARSLHTSTTLRSRKDEC